MKNNIYVVKKSKYYKNFDLKNKIDENKINNIHKTKIILSNNLFR